MADNDLAERLEALCSQRDEHIKECAQPHACAGAMVPVDAIRAALAAIPAPRVVEDALAAQGLPIDAGLDGLIEHHRTNARFAGVMEGMASATPEPRVVTREAVTRALVEAERGKMTDFEWSVVWRTITPTGPNAIRAAAVMDVLPATPPVATVTSVEELEALPIDTTVIDAKGRTLTHVFKESSTKGAWAVPGPVVGTQNVGLPATVLTASSAPVTAEDIEAGRMVLEHWLAGPSFKDLAHVRKWVDDAGGAPIEAIMRAVQGGER